MTHLVYDLFSYAVVEGFFVVINLAAVRRHPQTVCRDNASFSVEIRETEDKVTLAVKDINIGDSEILVTPAYFLGNADEAFSVVLPASFVVRFVGNRLGRARDHVCTVPLLQNFARRFDHAIGEVSNRNDIDTHGKRLAATDNKACVERRKSEDALVEYMRENYVDGTRIVEVGVGRRDSTACALADAGFEVTATDLRDVETGKGVDFARDDVTSPDTSVYEGASLVYSLRPPYEIHADIDSVARSVGADTLLVPLADEGTSLERDFELVNRDGRAFFVRRP